MRQEKLEDYRQEGATSWEAWEAFELDEGLEFDHDRFRPRVVNFAESELQKEAN